MKIKNIALSTAVLFSLAVISCKSGKNPNIKKGTTKKDWGQVDNMAVSLYTLTNSSGETVTISNFGGKVTSWIAPNKEGKMENIVLGFDSSNEYVTKNPPYFGALIGRYGNRIAKGMFKLGDSTYHLATNNGPNSLHGGLKGFDKVVWEANVVNDSIPELTLMYTSKNGEEGYPGNLVVTVKYTLTDDNELAIDYTAETDKPTVVNLTNHSYFNLSGDHANTILAEKLMIRASRYTPVDSTLIPTGELAPVAGTPFDFSQATAIGARISQVKGGYDHNWVLDRAKKDDLEQVAILSDSSSGRSLEVYTTEPGLQFYTGNFLDGKIMDSKGKPINQHTALCLETQHFPDSPNEPKFPTTTLKPGEKYHTFTKYKLVVEAK
jgi:aldose 1-epimerase